jgi:GH15 family glucan-1,4-alpha-glucosidase
MRSGLLTCAVATVAAACGGTDSKAQQQQQQQVCGQTLPATFEAETAQLQGVRVSANGKGFSGTGYVTDFEGAGKQVTFQLCAPESGYYTLEFGYAKGTDGIATRTLLVDGNGYPGQPMFSPLWTSSTWGSGGRRAIHLDAGNHAVALAFQQGDAGPIQLDKMVLSKGPSPSDVSVRSLLMNNWKDLVVGWHAAKVAPNDDRGYGPRMTAFHWGRDWPVNQIDEAQAFLRDETAGVSYVDTKQFDTTASFSASDADGYGAMRVVYNHYGGKALPMSVTRRMIVPPGQDFAVVLYDIGNVTDAPRQFSILEWADLHNKNVGPSEDPARSGEPLAKSGPSGTLSATWYAQYNAWIADLSQTNGTFLVMGSFGPMDHHVAGAPVTGAPDSGAATVQRFAAGPSTLGDSAAFSGPDIGIGMSKTITLESTRSATVAYFYGVAESLDAAKALAQSIESANAPQIWVDQSSNQWRDWLSSGKGTSLQTPVPQWADAFRIALVTNRQSQQPEFGSFVASTNTPYDYKVWPRDSSVTAMSFDAAGYLDEAEKFWTWMAGVQADGSDSQHPVGTWWTNYRFWANSEVIPFVEPELDSIGLFLIGTYRHYQALKPRDPARAARFLETVWPAAQKAADFVQGAVRQPDNFGFGAKDHSIWEEDLQFAVFTQTTYVSGLHAAQLLALERQDAARAQAWSQAGGIIRDAIFRDTSIAPCPGAWDAVKNYFLRAVQPDCTLDRRVDASTGLLWVFGLLEATNPRAAQQRRAIVLNLARGPLGYGIARYEGDEFYHTSPFSPGGVNEANATPVWPQMSMYTAMLEHWLGMDDIAVNRLSWYVATTSSGYESPGEAVDWTTERPLVSTASEPVTAAWYELALLNQLGMFDPRLP